MHKHKLAPRLRRVPRKVSERTLRSVFLSLCEAIDSPRSLKAWILYESSEFAQLVSWDVDPLDYKDCHSFSDDYLITKFLSKYPDFSHEDLDPEKAAETSFYEWEESCKLTNQKFKDLDLDPSLWDPTMHGILLLARRKIESILGRPDLDSIAENFGWGPGATTASTGNFTSAYVKFGDRLDVTSNSLIMGWCCINSTPTWVNCQLKTDEIPSVPASLTREAMNVVRGNEIVFVPKNAKTHRIIAKEPHVNSYLQKGFGAEIRRLLRLKAGVDLKDQSRNQRLAKLGSFNGSLATVDLKGASDSISTELVRFLLPPRWFVLLDMLRSKQGFMNGKWFHYHKFSSMGNAYTFELESLIFWALCFATLSVKGHSLENLSVYGDDLIVDANSYTDIAAVVNFCGFRVNKSKSYDKGPFRESCGKDYYFGIDVRPIFLKESVSNVESLYKLANSLRRYAHCRSDNYGCDRRFLAVYQSLVNLIPHDLRYKIPEGFGDVGLASNFDESVECIRLSHREKGWSGYFFKGITRHPVKRPMDKEQAGYTTVLSAAVALRGWDSRLGSHLVSETDIDARPLLGSHDLRKRTIPKVTRLHTFVWYDFGPWL